MVVVGGGVSGLSAAERLKETRPDLEVAVLERASTPGGWLGTTRAEGCTVELGPDAILRESGLLEKTAERLGLTSRLVSTRRDRSGAYVVRGGRLVRVPEGWSLLSPTNLGSLARADVLSVAARARVALEPLVPRRLGGASESLAGFVRRRVGWEALERLAQPLAGGIYGADAEILGIEATMPRFVKMEHDHGSLLRALSTAARSASGADAKATGARYGLFAAFDGGMQVLIDALAQRVRGSLVTGVEARAIVPADEGTGFIVVTDRAKLRADAVVLALPSPRASPILRGSYASLAAALDEVPHGSAATVTFILRRTQVGHALDAYGFVVPAIERRRILASTWASEKWPGRAPDDLVVLRVFSGGHDDADPTREDDASLERSAMRELRDLMNVEGEPLYARVVRYPKAMPRYQPEHAAVVARATAAAAPGLFLAGNSLHGVGIPAAMAAGIRAADAAAAFTSRALEARA